MSNNHAITSCFTSCFRQCLEPLSFPPSPPPVVHIDQAAQEQQRRQEWESGHPDYHGADQFDNIQAHLDSQLD